MSKDAEQHSMDVLSYWCAVELFSPRSWGKDPRLLYLRSSSDSEGRRANRPVSERLPWEQVRADLLIGLTDREIHVDEACYKELQKGQTYHLQTDMKARLTEPFSFVEATKNWLCTQTDRSGIDDQFVSSLVNEANRSWTEVSKQSGLLQVGTILTDSMVSRLLQIVRELSTRIGCSGVACAAYHKNYDPQFARQPNYRLVKLAKGSGSAENLGRKSWLHHEWFRISVGLSQDVCGRALATAARLVRELSPTEEAAQDEGLQELAYRKQRRTGNSQGIASLMEFCVGDEGDLIPRSLDISQYAKAVSCLFNNESWPDCPAGWPHIEVFDQTEREIKDLFNHSAGKTPGDGEEWAEQDSEPVYRSDIEELVDLVADRIGLSDDSVGRSPLFSHSDGSPLIRNYVNCCLETKPERMMDSFFLDDLERLYQGGPATFSEPVRQYLSMDHPQRFNLEENQGGKLIESLEPASMSAGRWPSASKRFQSAGQQLAINQIRAAIEGSGSSSLLGVNGPPGTGKTTLLKDVVSEIIVARAKRLTEFSDPKDIFMHQKEGGNTSREIKNRGYWALDPKVTGFEVVVASSNNKAVQNVSQDLPSADAIDDEWESYIEREFNHVPLGFDFRDFAEHLADTEGKSSGTSSAWALISAVLGNKTNRSRFLKPLKEKFIEGYLGKIPDSERGGNTWVAAQAAFAEAVKKEEGIRAQKTAQYKLIDSFLDLCNRRSALLDNLKTNNERLLRMKTDRSEYMKRIEVVERQMAEAGQVASSAGVVWERANSTYRVHISYWREHPLRSLFHGKERQQDELKVRTDLDQARLVKEHCDKRVSEANQQLQSLNNGLRAGDRNLQECEVQISSSRRELSVLEEQISEAERIRWSTPRIGDDRIEWMDEEWNKARTELFIKALALHQQVVIGAPHQFMCNLSLACTAMQSNDLSKGARLAAWQTFFLVIPVVSTSFASVSRMLSGVWGEAFGWAIVDEAGQALPQSAVGLLQRVKHAIAVGDPMQLQPVDPMPKPMHELLASTHNIQLSLESENMQVLVDYQTPCGLLDGIGNRWLGMPLVVHRRCDEPMFSICNNMAYSGRMVRVGPEHQPCTYPSGPHAGSKLPVSCWYDVPSDSGMSSSTQWRREEGDELRKRMRELLQGGVDPANILVVTPFRAVATEVCEIFESEIMENLCYDHGAARSLAREQAGTVHTSQGREADVVFIVLGSKYGSQGAKSRSWVNESPNLLNVAVSRAKRRVYMIGDLSDWKDGAYTSMIAKELPVVRGDEETREVMPEWQR